MSRWSDKRPIIPTSFAADVVLVGRASNKSNSFAADVVSVGQASNKYNSFAANVVLVGQASNNSNSFCYWCRVGWTSAQ